jgi:hypothetical protein
MMSEEIAGPASPTYPAKTVWFLAIMGVLLPIAALVVEAWFGFLKGSLLDPLPTLMHGVLVAIVPLANFFLARALHRGDPVLPPVLNLLHAFAMGISLLYALLFLPFTPIAPLAIVYYGIGLLPLAPLLSLVAAIVARRTIARITGAAPPHLRRGMALALVALILLDMPATLNRIGLHMATAQAPATQLAGVRWLRAVGSERIMLRHCYSQSGTAGGLMGALLDLHSHVDTEQARSVFYRVTGTPYNSHAAPVMRSGFDWERTFDADRGGDKVGQRTHGVSLASSRMDGSVDANAALGYLEWTMVFKNSSALEQEARAELMLPAGAVVSRATLWINGEEREAAFGARSQVRAAYEKVVRQSRDPLLVTTAGPDRVLVQLFPILPNGEMKIRIGITAPMAMRDLRTARLQLPSFSERNFEIDAALRHALWVESSSALQGGPALRHDKVSDNLFALRGDLPEPLAGQSATSIAATRSSDNQATWSVDDQGADRAIIVQTLDETPARAPHRIAIVIDGSLSMKHAKTQLSEALAALPPTSDIGYIFAGDTDPVLVHHHRHDSQANRDYLAGLDFQGGRDNTAALALAWDWAGDGVIVWIHGAQPEFGAAGMKLQQYLERRPGQAAVYDVEAAPGQNAIARKLDGLLYLHRVARAGTLDADVRTLFQRWAAGAVQVTATRQRQAADSLPNARKTSSHLTRLWAAQQVATMNDPKDAIAMAVRYQLVTPVSGAVVLETVQEYDAAGLAPVPPGSVPTIPEPETWLLIIVALGVLALRLRKRSA